MAGRVAPKSNLSASISGTGASGSFLFPSVSPSKGGCVPWSCFDEVLPARNATEKKPEKSFSLEKIWAYMTIQDILKKRQVIDDAKTIVQFNEKALNLSLSVCFNL